MTLSELKKLAQSFKPEPLAEDEEYDCSQCAKCTATIHVEPGNEWENGYDLCWGCLDEWHSAITPTTALRMIELLEEAKDVLEELNDILSDPEARKEADSFTAQPAKRWLKDLEEL